MSPQNAIVNYKLFKVIARDNGKLKSIACVKNDLTIEWNDASNVPAVVQKSISEFISDME